MADGTLSVTPDTPEAIEFRTRRSTFDSVGASSSYLEDETGESAHVMEARKGLLLQAVYVGALATHLHEHYRLALWGGHNLMVHSLHQCELMWDIMVHKNQRFMTMPA